MELREVRELVRDHLPGPVGEVRPLGSGCDNEAFLVDGLVVRVARVPDLERVGQEARLLAAVAEVSPLPVPEVVFVDQDRGCLAYRYLPGRPLAEAGERVLDQLLEFITRTHAAEMTGLVTVDDHGPADWHAETVGTYEVVREHVPERHRAAVERFLAEAPPTAGPERVFSHNDLGTEHILADGGSITGIIDWSDAEITDPAHDFATLYRDLGPSVVDGQPPDIQERALFYARCDALEDMAFGLRRHTYLDKAVRALSWLF